MIVMNVKEFHTFQLDTPQACPTPSNSVLCDPTDCYPSVDDSSLSETVAVAPRSDPFHSDTDIQTARIYQSSPCKSTTYRKGDNRSVLTKLLLGYTPLVDIY